MSIESLFLREIAGEHGLIEVVHGAGAAFVSVYTGPFILQIEIGDLKAVIAAMGVVANGGNTDRQVRLREGALLSVARGAEGTHVWISSCDAHLRITHDIANAIIAALSEAHRHITIHSGAAQPGRATCSTP